MGLLSNDSYPEPLTTTDRLNLLLAAGLRSVPHPVLRLLGKRVNSDGQTLDADVFASLRGLELVSEDFSDMPVAEGRKLIDTDSKMGAGPQIPVGSVTDIEVAGVPVRHFRPLGSGREKLPTLVYLHGGGWVLGSLISHDNTARYFCAQANVAVLLVDYPLAPEHPFPAAINATTKVVQEVMKGAVEGVDPSRVALGGDSAGGNLSAATCINLAQRGEPQPALQLLFVPVTNLRDFDSPTYREFADGHYLTAKQMVWYRDHYIPHEADRSNPLASPLLADEETLGKVAPAFVSVAGHDPLRGEGEAYARSLAAAGVPTTCRRNKALIHPFVNSFWVWRDAKRAMDEAVGALRMALGIFDE